MKKGFLILLCLFIPPVGFPLMALHMINQSMRHIR